MAGGGKEDHRKRQVVIVSIAFHIWPDSYASREMSAFVKCSVILFCSNCDWHFRKWWSPPYIKVEDVEEHMCDPED